MIWMYYSKINKQIKLTVSVLTYVSRFWPLQLTWSRLEYRAEECIESICLRRKLSTSRVYKQGSKDQIWKGQKVGITLKGR